MSKITLNEAKVQEVINMRAAFDKPFDTMMKVIQERIKKILSDGDVVVCDTDANRSNLWSTYISKIVHDEKEAARAHHNCNCCRRFIEKFGGLVAVYQNGNTIPLLWPGDETTLLKISTHYRASVKSMAMIVVRAKITNLYISSHTDKIGDGPIVGFDKNGSPWQHFTFNLTGIQHCGNRYPKQYTDEQRMAQSSQEFEMLQTILNSVKRDEASKLLSVLQVFAEGSERRFIDAATQLSNFITGAWTKRNAKLYASYIWYSAAKLSSDVIHFRNTAIGSLLEDLRGMSDSRAYQKFREKLGPQNYMRPKADVSIGNVKAADKLIRDLGLDMSDFLRKQARYDDPHIEWIWKTREQAKKSIGDNVGITAQSFAGFFAGETSKSKRARFSDEDVSLAKFLASLEYLKSSIVSVEIYIPPLTNLPFAGITKSLNQKNGVPPKILKWTEKNPHNDFSWYMYLRGSSPTTWNISSYGWREVTGIMTTPKNWGRDLSITDYENEQFLFVIKNCYDKNERIPLGLFPELLIKELMPVRNTIENFSNENGLKKSPCAIGGLMINNIDKKSPYKIRITVRQHGVSTNWSKIFVIDRKI